MMIPVEYGRGGMGVEWTPLQLPPQVGQLTCPRWWGN